MIPRPTKAMKYYQFGGGYVVSREHLKPHVVRQS